MMGFSSLLVVDIFDYASVVLVTYRLGYPMYNDNPSSARPDHALVDCDINTSQAVDTKPEHRMWKSNETIARPSRIPHISPSQCHDCDGHGLRYTMYRDLASIRRSPRYQTPDEASSVSTMSTDNARQQSSVCQRRSLRSNRAPMIVPDSPGVRRCMSARKAKALLPEER